MKFCVIANLSFSKKATRKSLDDKTKAWLVGKSTWGTAGLGMGTGEQGKPCYNLEIRFNHGVDMDELYTFIKNKMDSLLGVKGTVSKHYCSHDGLPVPCIIKEQYTR